MTRDDFAGIPSADWQGKLSPRAGHALVVFALVLTACDSGEGRSTAESLSTIRSAGPVEPEPRQPVEAIRCEGTLEADGSRSLHHEARFFPDGSVSTTCSVRVGSTEWLGSAEYQWGRTGQPGAVCEVDVEGGFWRFAVVQDHSATIATRVQAGRSEEWLLTCSR